MPDDGDLERYHRYLSNRINSIITPDGIVSLHACVPLETAYKLLLAKQNIIQDCDDEFAIYQILSQKDSENTFDLATMTNARAPDHSINPKTYLIEELQFLIPG